MAASDSYATNDDVALVVSAAQGVLGNDTDPDGDPLASALVQRPANGTVTVNPDGSFSYVPNAKFSGTDTFIYGVTDVRYRIVPLGTLGGNNSFALDVNNNRQVTGNSSITAGASNPLQAYLWQNGTMTGLGVLPGTGSNNFSRGYAVNDFGVVVGESDNDASKAFVYQNGTMTGLTRLAGDNFNGVAHDVNNSGAIVGISSNGTASRPTIWTLINGTYVPADLNTIAGTPNSTGRAWAINNAGVAVGLSQNASNLSQATRWSGGAVTNLTSLGDGTRFSQAFGVNGAGQIVGSSSTGQTVGQLTGTTSGTGITRAFIWENGAIRELLPHNFFAPGNTGATTNYHSVANDVNDAGVVAGNSQRIAGSATAATVWDNGAAMDLNALIAPGSGWVLRSAEGINQGGDIAGFGSFGGFTRAFLLVPEVTSPNGRIFSATATVTITVGAPTISDVAAQTVNQNTPTGAIAFTVGDAKTPVGDLLVTATSSDAALVPNANIVLGGSGANRTVTITSANQNAQSGTTTITLSVTDADGLTATDTFVLTVVNDAPVNTVPGTQTTSEDTALVLGGANKTISVRDADNASLSVTLSVTNGTLSLSGTSGLTFTTGDGTSDATMTFSGTQANLNAALDGLSFSPTANQSGGATLTIKSSDGTVANDDTDTVAITIGPVNDAPVAQDQSLTATTTAPLNITLGATDIDSPQSALSFSVLTQPTNGTLSGSGASLRYVARRGFSGSDSFTFRASDGALNSNVATITLRVSDTNAAPVARDDSAPTAFNTPITVQVLANDSDAEGDTLSISAVNGAGTRGTLGISADKKSITFTPESGFSGSTSFGYSASDGVASSSARVTVTVTPTPEPPVTPTPEPPVTPTPGPINRAPQAVADSYSTRGRLQVLVSEGLLANDTDADGDALTATLKSEPAHGILSLQPNGAFTYTPAVGYSGADSFTYATRDGQAESAVATVSLAVTSTPDVTAPTLVVVGGGLRIERRLIPLSGSSVDVSVLKSGIVVSSDLKSTVVRLQRAGGDYWNGKSYQKTPFNLPTQKQGRAFFTVPSSAMPPLSQAPGGRYKWTAIATDNAGNISRAVQFMLVDATAPVLVISTPAAGTDSIVRLSKLENVSGRASETAKIEVALRDASGAYFNGRTFASTPTFFATTQTGATWSLRLPSGLALSAGRYSIQVRATDQVGNIGTAQRAVQVASTPIG